MADIREKIKKLLALATSPNENEARDALLKARELMAKNKLDESEFEEATKKELKHITCDVKWTTDSGNIWMVGLAKLIAENNCCVSGWKTSGRTHTLVITGVGDDADTCKVMVEYAIGFVLGQLKIQHRKRPDTDARAITTSYTDGFVLGLEFAYEEQKEEHPEWGLVVVEPEEVRNYKDHMGSRSVRTKKADFDPLAYLKGQKDGQEFNKRKALEVSIS